MGAAGRVQSAPGAANRHQHRFGAGDTNRQPYGRAQHDFAHSYPAAHQHAHSFLHTYPARHRDRQRRAGYY